MFQLNNIIIVIITNLTNALYQQLPIYHNWAKLILIGFQHYIILFLKYLHNAY